GPYDGQPHKTAEKRPRTVEMVDLRFN
nr:3B [tottorivirus A1]